MAAEMAPYLKSQWTSGIGVGVGDGGVFTILFCCAAPRARWLRTSCWVIGCAVQQSEIWACWALEQPLPALGSPGGEVNNSSYYRMPIRYDTVQNGEGKKGARNVVYRMRYKRFWNLCTISITSSRFPTSPPPPLWAGNPRQNLRRASPKLGCYLYLCYLSQPWLQ
ncbi:hypothetical protein BGX38DRAFT_238090 [Terfezia claveryi]|nr:hypothetical protein BGX38DRAFT_238090 [Terfezia claveryi]